ncbi:MAG: MarR family transcriptional regulator [Actinomycetota bacterium]
MNHTPRWLDSTEMRIWLAYLEATGRVGQRLEASLKATGAMSLEDYEVLVHLSEADGGRLRMTELSNRLLHSQSRLSQRVDRLVARDLVRREKCPDDRRGTFAVITDHGFDTIRSLAPRHVADVRELLIDQIEPHEREILADVLERIARSAREGDAAVHQ